MTPKPSRCVGCPLETLGQGFVPADLRGGSSRVLLVGEAAGENEARESTPFIGKAGGQLEGLLRRAGFTREQFAIDNACKCRPPGNELRGASYEWAALDHCAPYLDETIERFQPKCIVALGAIPLRRLTGFDSIMRYRGWPIWSDRYGVWIVPTFHPAFLLPRRGEESSSKYVGVVVHDLRLAVEIAHRGFVRTEPDYLLDPDYPAAERFVMEYEQELQRNPNLVLAWDLETSGKIRKMDESELEEIDFEILRSSYSFRPGYAMSIPHQGQYIELVKRMLNSSGPKCGWNSRQFDEPVIRTNGIEPQGELFDAMDAFKVLKPALPRRLEFASSFYCPDHLLPWKHLAKSNFAYYSAVDADAQLSNFLGIRRDLQS